MVDVMEEMAGMLEAPETDDPADLEADVLGDATTAGKRRKKTRQRSGDQDDSGSVPLPATKGRLRLRAGIPELPEYAGHKVSRKEAFSTTADDEEGVHEDVDDMRDLEDDDLEQFSAGGDFAAPGAGNFSISGSLEEEYEKLMKKSDHQLQVMRTPSVSDVAKREAEAKQLQSQLTTWRGLVEFRIHLEEALTVAHRLPVASARTAFCNHNEAASSSLEQVTSQSTRVLGNLLELQRQIGTKRGVPLPGLPEEAAPKKRKLEETKAWEAVDGQLQSVLDWALRVADKWKEQTRLDARRTFKVLDQPLSQQMRTIADTEPAKFRARSVPPPEKHKVIGREDTAEAEASTEKDEAAATASSTPTPEQEIFDDREFYVHLLREVLSTGGTPGSSLDADEAKALQAELQGRRANKKKAKAEVDRKASKGRKIRYVQIEKLQNFMAPRKRYGGTDGQCAFNDTFLTMEDRGGDAATEAMLKSLFSNAAPGA
mmetsp:Transcript_9220/g.20570  ORF Transcript_9220/g.20570 Transcript_9220/m.20570 type:complete len:486 (+) Transcript_9220:82-1539(+)